MMICKRTIAIALLLSLTLLITASAALAAGKDDAAQQWIELRSVAAERAQDPAVAKKAEEQARIAAELAANQKTETPWPADSRLSPAGTARPLYDPRVSVLLTEGFESGAVPPPGWSSIVNNAWTWVAANVDPFEGTYHADCEYDPNLVPQNEWLQSPMLNLSSVTTDIRVEFYWFMSYYWGVDPFNNYDIQLWVSSDGGATFPTKLWDESAQGVFSSWTYYKASVSLSAYIGEPDVVLGFRYVGVDGAEASLDFINVTDDAPPVLGPGDNCADPEKIDLPGGLPYANSNMTCGRGNDYSETCLGSYDGGEDIVYEITVTSPITVDIKLDPLGTTWTGMTVDDMCPPDGSCLVVKTNGGSSAPMSALGVVLAPGTYYLMVDTWPTPDCVPAFNLAITESVTGNPGDNCANPLKIDIPTLPYSDLGQTTCGRLNHYDATCLGSYDNGEDIIYEVTVTSPVTVDITLDPHGTDYTGFVIDAACPPGGTGCIGSSTSSGTTPHTIYAVSLTPGTYYIMVDTWPTPNCIPIFDLHITAAGGGPANDNWQDAEKVDNVTDLPFCTAGGSLDGPGDDDCNDCANVWYCYTASCNGRVTVDLCGSDYDSKLGVYDGCGEPTLANQLACNDDACGLQSTVEFIAVAGHEYLIEVGGYLGSSCAVGCGDISISCALLCQVDIPVGSTSEGETCGDNTNGGCNSPTPVFRPIACGETVHGTGWFDGSTRDTDWYLLTLTGYNQVTFTVQAEFDALIGPLETTVPGSSNCADLTGYISPAAFPLECQSGSVTFTVGPGSYLLFVAPIFGGTVVCPADYWASVTCVPVAPAYCDAAGGTCDEYISNVTVGSINNSSDCNNYGDYTALSTSMNIGTAYPITVANGYPYTADQCGIWVDWNHDADFFDANETIVVSGTPGGGPYSGSITPPASAVAGATRLRARITYTGAVSPCGTTQYGEVEDYTVVVVPSSNPLQMGLDPDPIYAAMAHPVEPHCVDIYIGGELTPGHGPGDVNLASLLVNGTLPAVQSELLPSHPGFTGAVLHICVDMAAFVGGYGILYNTTTQSYSVSGAMSDASPFLVNSNFSFVGHISGDVNMDRKVNVLDLTYIVQRIFFGGPMYLDPIGADINADGSQGNVMDLTYIIDYFFRGGPPPAELK